VAALTAGVVTGVGAMMANPLVAEAAVTPSLKCAGRWERGGRAGHARRLAGGRALRAAACQHQRLHA
jgi:hypothetical protein